jgi:hypothetical protein
MFWLGQQRKSGIGFASRYNTDKMVRSWNDYLYFACSFCNKDELVIDL